MHGPMGQVVKKQTSTPDPSLLCCPIFLGFYNSLGGIKIPMMINGNLLMLANIPLPFMLQFHLLSMLIILELSRCLFGFFAVYFLLFIISSGISFRIGELWIQNINIFVKKLILNVAFVYIIM